jgi:hypothetical protein
MKQAEMRVGREYAHRRGKVYYATAVRVKVLETKLHRDDRYGYPMDKADGVRVAFLNADGGVRQERVVPSSHIVSTWAAEKARIAAKAQANEEQQAEREKAQERLKAAKEAVGLTVDFGSRMGVEQLEHFGALLSAARKVVNGKLELEKVEDLREAIYTFDFR